MIDHVHVELATPADQAWIVDRAKQFSHSVGFLPRRAYEQQIHRGRVWVARYNGWIAGAMVCTGGTDRPLVFRQNLVERELWEHRIGRALTIFLQRQSALFSQAILRVRTRCDLMRQMRINARCGGHVHQLHPGGRHRGIEVAEWHLPAQLRGIGDDVILIPDPERPSRAKLWLPIRQRAASRADGRPSTSTGPPTAHAATS